MKTTKTMTASGALSVSRLDMTRERSKLRSVLYAVCSAIIRHGHIDHAIFGCRASA